MHALVHLHLTFSATDNFVLSNESYVPLVVKKFDFFGPTTDDGFIRALAILLVGH